MADDDRQPAREVPGHVVVVAVADARGGDAHAHLARARVVELEILDAQRLARLVQHRRPHRAQASRSVVTARPVVRRLADRDASQMVLQAAGERTGLRPLGARPRARPLEQVGDGDVILGQARARERIAVVDRDAHAGQPALSDERDVGLAIERGQQRLEEELVLFLPEHGEHRRARHRLAGGVAGDEVLHVSQPPMLVPLWRIGSPLEPTIRPPWVCNVIGGAP